VDIECKLVGKIKPNHALRVMPEDSELRNFDFNDLEDFDSMSKAILKRRFIDSLVLGAANDFCDPLMFKGSLPDGGKLVSIYEDIRVISDYLLFTKEETISDKHPMQGSCVEVELGRDGEKTHIFAQGINFMFLLMETARGFYELFASHGLPSDNKKAEYILRQADILIAEPWDLRFGVTLWNKIADTDKPYYVLPYYFMSLCEMPCEDFNGAMKEILMNTKKGQELRQHLLDRAEHDYEMSDLEHTITQKSKDGNVIEDGYMSDEDIDNSVIEEEGEGDNEPNYRELFLSCKGHEDLDFQEEQMNDVQFRMTVLINGIPIPVEVINFKAEPRFVVREDLNQLHLFIREDLRHLGMGYKIHRRFVELYGNAYCGFGRMLNQEEVPRIFKKLGTEPNIHVETVRGVNGGPIGIKAELIQN
jgi:hypothetical protein